jgi:hypothetical protein
MFHLVVLHLIAHHTTRQGAKIRALLTDENSYETGKQVSEEELAALKLKPETFYGEWNYQLLPRRRTC